MTRLSSFATVVPRDYRAELDAMLAESGGFYTFEDIMECIRTGQMQSFAKGDTWVVTQINEFPRKRVVEIVYVVGELSMLPVLEAEVIQFAHGVGAEMLMAAGRRGFEAKHLVGWKATTTNFVREI